MPRVEKFEKGAPLHSYKCKRKHVYEDFGPWEIVIVYEGKRASSGPVCPFCYLEWLRKQFGAKETAPDA